jgi:hypothetical protein
LIFMRNEDFNIIDLANREMRIISNFPPVTIDEYFMSSEEVEDKSPENIIECVFINRMEHHFLTDSLNDSITEFFVLSIMFNKLGQVDRAFKWRKYSIICKLIKQLNSRLVWNVKYIGDHRCYKCAKFCGINYNLESEVINPKIPVVECNLPNGLCTADAIFEVVRDEFGAPKHHNKDYSKLLKIIIDKN